jgi:hypothetical protein
MLHVPGVRHFLPVTPLEAIRGGANDFGDDERSLPRGRELVHAVGLLDTPKDEAANVEGSLPNTVIVVAPELLVVMGFEFRSPAKFCSTTNTPTSSLDPPPTRT